jgi:hypothetical protein
MEGMGESVREDLTSVFVCNLQIEGGFDGNEYLIEEYHASANACMSSNNYLIREGFIFFTKRGV